MIEIQLLNVSIIAFENQVLYNTGKTGADQLRHGKSYPTRAPARCTLAVGGVDNASIDATIELTLAEVTKLRSGKLELA